MKGKEEKKDYDQNIGLHEVFLESVPTVLIILVIFIRALGKNILMIFVTVSRVDCYHTQLGINLIIILQGALVMGFWVTSSSVRAPLSVVLMVVSLNSS